MTSTDRPQSDTSSDPSSSNHHIADLIVALSLGSLAFVLLVMGILCCFRIMSRKTSRRDSKQRRKHGQRFANSNAAADRQLQATSMVREDEGSRDEGPPAYTHKAAATSTNSSLDVRSAESEGLPSSTRLAERIPSPPPPSYGGLGWERRAL